ncbi:hypothetical protein [Arsukibacterium sp.]|uniref:DUF7010 family protein n=1 Tax=Arsukibacterium sp. TaxID=1977258 RepID=UPI00356A4B55
MDFTESQNDMNSAFTGGATGVFASGLVWLIAGVVGVTMSNVAAMYALFIGGMFIVPLSIFFSKLLSATGKLSSKNVLRHLALETLPVLFGGLLIAFYVAQIKIELFFPIMLLAIGARYFAFHTLYAIKEYWLLGALLMVAGVACPVLGLPFIAGAFAGAVLEIVFALILFRKSKMVLSAARQQRA